MGTFFIVIGAILVIYLVLKQGLLQKIFEPKISKIYALLIVQLGKYAFNNQGVMTSINSRKFQIYKTDSCQILYFELNNNDDLLIEWRFKYYQQEMIFKYTVNRSDFDTHDFAKTEWYFNDIIIRFNKKLDIHKMEVDNKGIPEKILSEFGISAQQYQYAKDFFN